MMPDRKEIEPTLIGIATALARVEQNQEDFRREILGNGQPGRLSRVEADLKEHKEKLDRVDRKVFYYSGGISVGLLFLKIMISKAIAFFKI